MDDMEKKLIVELLGETLKAEGYQVQQLTRNDVEYSLLRVLPKRVDEHSFILKVIWGGERG